MGEAVLQKEIFFHRPSSRGPNFEKYMKLLSKMQVFRCNFLNFL